MNESQFGFSYSWQELKPVRPLIITVIILQLMGAGLLYGLALKSHWFENLWLGAALLTFPGYLIGLITQYRINKNSLSKHKVMVRRLGLIALILTLVGLFVPPIGLIHLF